MHKIPQFIIFYENRNMISYFESFETCVPNFLFLHDFLLFKREKFLLRGRGRGKGKRRRRGRERDNHIDMREKYRSVASCIQPDWDWTHTLGMWPDHELNRWYFSAWDYAQSIHPHWPWIFLLFCSKNWPVLKLSKMKAKIPVIKNKSISACKISVLKWSCRISRYFFIHFILFFIFLLNLLGCHWLIK